MFFTGLMLSAPVGQGSSFAAEMNRTSHPQVGTAQRNWILVSALGAAVLSIGLLVLTIWFYVE